MAALKSHVLLDKDTDSEHDRLVSVIVMVVLSTVDAIWGILGWADKRETPEHDRIL